MDEELEKIESEKSIVDVIDESISFAMAKHRRRSIDNLSSFIALIAVGAAFGFIVGMRVMDNLNNCSAVRLGYAEWGSEEDGSCQWRWLTPTEIYENRKKSNQLQFNIEPYQPRPYTNSKHNDI